MNSSSIFPNIIFFILWPFASFINALVRLEEKVVKFIFPLFSAYQGFTYTIFSPTTDAYRYKLDFESMAASSGVLSSLKSQYLAENDGVLDLGVRLISFIVSIFTDDFRVYFAILGLILGLFLVNLIWFIIEKAKFRISTLFDFLLILAVFFVVGTWDIGGRWNIAVVIFTLGLVYNEHSNNRRGKFLMIISVFFHWSFVIAVITYILFKVIGNRTLIYFALLVLSFFIDELNITPIRNLWFSYAPGFLIESRSGYLSDHYLDSLNDTSIGLNWYIVYHSKMLGYFLLFSVGYLVIFKRQDLIKNQFMYRIVNAGMFFLAIFNFLSSIPSMGRFLVIGIYLLLFTIMFMIKNTKFKLPAFVHYFGYLSLIFYVIVRFRIGLDFWSSHTIFGNVFTAVVSNNPQPFIEIIKTILN